VQLRARLLALINGKLLPKGSSLQAEIVARYQECSQVRQRREQERNHPSDATELDDGRFETLLNLSILCTDDILMTHRYCTFRNFYGQCLTFYVLHDKIIRPDIE
jgi:hypothetical protein